MYNIWPTSSWRPRHCLETKNKTVPLTWNTSGKNNNTTNNNNMTKKLLNPLKLRTLTIFVHVMAVARSSSGSLVIRYVFPVLWMTSCLLISQSCSTSPPPEAQCTRSLGLGYKWYAVIAVAGQCTHGTTFWALKSNFPCGNTGGGVCGLWLHWKHIYFHSLTWMLFCRIVSVICHRLDLAAVFTWAALNSNEMRCFVSWPIPRFHRLASSAVTLVWRSQDWV